MVLIGSVERAISIRVPGVVRLADGMTVAEAITAYVSGGCRFDGSRKNGTYTGVRLFM